MNDPGKYRRLRARDTLFLELAKPAHTLEELSEWLDSRIEVLRVAAALIGPETLVGSYVVETTRYAIRVRDGAVAVARQRMPAEPFALALVTTAFVDYEEFPKTVAYSEAVCYLLGMDIDQLGVFLDEVSTKAEGVNDER